ncbi:hypothetical protein RhiirA5_350255 [Rhizophagus irregularis]|nr:hypothetical protein RhiirA5_350255 [Rhizophagus irregularis]
MFKKIEENYLAQPYQAGENILSVDSMMIPQYSDMNTSLNLQSGDDEGGSDSGGFEYNDDTTSGGPTTPPTNGQQVHPESKCYNNSSNNVSQHPAPIVTTSAASEFSFYDSYNPYYMDSNYTMNTMNTMNPMNFLPPTTTSPTDEPMTSWNLNSN